MKRPTGKGHRAKNPDVLINGKRLDFKGTAKPSRTPLKIDNL